MLGAGTKPHPIYDVPYRIPLLKYLEITTGRIVSAKESKAITVGKLIYMRHHIHLVRKHINQMIK